MQHKNDVIIPSQIYEEYINEQQRFSQGKQVEPSETLKTPIKSKTLISQGQSASEQLEQSMISLAIKSHQPDKKQHLGPLKLATSITKDIS